MVSINKDNQQAITDVSSFISRQWQVESNRYIRLVIVQLELLNLTKLDWYHVATLKYL